jgi:hypothetical protein
MATPLAGHNPSTAELLELDKPRRRRRARRARPVVVELCDRCGGTTSSYSRFFCAACHFAGWWGQWA